MKKTFYISLMILSIISCKKGSTTENCDKNINITDIKCNSINVATTVNGFTINHFPGSTVIESEGSYNRGIQIGFWKFNFINGTTYREGSFDNKGKIQGFWKQYYLSGNVEQEGSYNNCIREGFWKFFHDNNSNQVKMEGNCKNGLKEGAWKTYNVNGEIIKEENC